VVQWPTTWLEREISTDSITDDTAICVLSHDARFDAELIALALASPAGYVGAMGSRTTHDRRVASLAERGVTDLGRLHSPIGLDIGASTPAETAVSILAEVLASRSGASGRPLSGTSGAIHAGRVRA
jgi:xanthine dehydrogenase accessory factor